MILPPGVGFIHLLNDGIGKIAEVPLEYPSLGFTLATIGTLIVLGFEQLALMLISRVNVAEDKIVPTKDIDAECNHLELEVVSAVPNTHQSSCDHTHAINMIAGSDSIGIIIKAYMMEISVAIHSVIIGIALGSLAGPDNLAPLSALLIAICFHQFFEGLGLGEEINVLMYSDTHQ
jgi:zinc transporter 1/2/3